MVEFTTGQYQPENLFLQHQQMMSHVPLTYRVQKRREDFTRPAHFKLPQDFVRIQGRASYLADGSHAVVSFSALPNKEAFRVLVREELEFAGDDAEFENLGDRVTIQAKSRVATSTVVKKSYQPDGTVKETAEEVEVKSTFSKAHIAYYDGLSVGGPKYAFHVDGSILVKEVKRGQGWDWGQLIYPQRFDLNARSAGLKSWSLVKSVQLQRRDGELEDTFALRKSVLSIQHEFRERLWLDGEVWQASVTEPTEYDSEWAYNLSLTSLPKTDLAQQFQELSQVSVPEIEHSGKTVLKISVGTRLPDKYRELLQPIVRQLMSREPMIQKASLELLESGRVASQGVLFLDANDELVVNAVGSLGESNVTATSLVQWLGGAVVGQTAEFPLPLQYGEWNLKLKGVADLNGSFLRLAAIRPEAATPALPTLQDGSNSRGLLLSISGDLSPLLALPAEHPSRGILQQLELFHHLFELPTMSPKKDETAEIPSVIHRMQKWEPKSANFESILGNFSNEENWSFHINVRTDSRSQLKVTVKVGEALWTYWRCREYMSRGPQRMR